MKKFKTKLFLTIFFILMLLEFLVGLTDVLLSKSSSGLSMITSKLMFLFSFPISMISRDLPFYTNEGTVAVVIFWIMNIIIQAIIVYGLISMYRGSKSTW